MKILELIRRSWFPTPGERLERQAEEDRNYVHRREVVGIGFDALGYCLRDAKSGCGYYLMKRSGDRADMSATVWFDTLDEAETGLRRERARFARAVRKLEIAVLFLVLAAGVAGAQEPGTPAPDPLAVTSAAEGWIWAERSWAPPAEAKDLAGGRFQALLGVGRWGVAVRGDVSGLPGTFDISKLQTFRSAQALLGVHRNLYGVGSIQLGVAGGFGGAVPLVVEDGSRPRLPHTFTAGIGLRAAAPGWWVYAAAGQHYAVPGVSGILVYQVRTSSRTAAVGTFAIGRTSFAQFGVAVRWF
jgi:hypothetical protein